MIFFTKQVSLEPIHGSGLLKLAVKLKRAKLALKTWNRIYSLWSG